MVDKDETKPLTGTSDGYVDVLTSASTPVMRCSAPLVLLGGRGLSTLRPGVLLAGARVRRREQLICLLGTPTMAPTR